MIPGVTAPVPGDLIFQEVQGAQGCTAKSDLRGTACLWNHAETGPSHGVRNLNPGSWAGCRASKRIGWEQRRHVAVCNADIPFSWPQSWRT